MNTGSVLAHDGGVTLGALGLRYASGVRIGLVPLVAGGTPDLGVRSALDLLGLVGVARGTHFPARLREAKRNRSPEGEPQGRQDDGEAHKPTSLP